MNNKTNADFFNQITHIGYHSESNIIIWNEIIKGSVDCNFFPIEKIDKKANDLILSYRIADQNVLLNKEENSFVFFLNEHGDIFYINIIHNIKKQINNSNNKCIEINVLLEEIAYKNTYPYHFVFKSNLTFHFKKEIVFDFINNSTLNKNLNEELNLDFYIDELSTISKIEKDYLNKAKIFTLILKHNKNPTIIK